MDNDNFDQQWDQKWIDQDRQRIDSLCQELDSKPRSKIAQLRPLLPVILKARKRGISFVNLAASLATVGISIGAKELSACCSQECKKTKTKKAKPLEHATAPLPPAPKIPSPLRPPPPPTSAGGRDSAVSDPAPRPGRNGMPPPKVEPPGVVRIGELVHYSVPPDEWFEPVDKPSQGNGKDDAVS